MGYRILSLVISLAAFAIIFNFWHRAEKGSKHRKFQLAILAFQAPSVAIGIVRLIAAIKGGS
jgi:hypothetical protein